MTASPEEVVAIPKQTLKEIRALLTNLLEKDGKSNEGSI